MGTVKIQCCYLYLFRLTYYETVGNSNCFIKQLNMDLAALSVLFLYLSVSPYLNFCETQSATDSDSTSGA